MTLRKTLYYQELGIDSSYQHIAFLSTKNPICLSEGLAALSQVEVFFEGQSLVATLLLLDIDTLAEDEIGLSKNAAQILRVTAGCQLEVSAAKPPQSLPFLRAKIHGQRLNQLAFDAILADILQGQYSTSQTSAFLTLLAAQTPDRDETAALTASMVACGERLRWNSTLVADKHCVGGLPGNRTTPIVVAIMTACGVVMPKTSSRAITSPAGTADVLETMTRVNLSLTEMRTVVAKQGGCLVWGGAFTLSPADAILIQVARSLELDGDAQLVASILSKKIAAGATHVLIDMPVGPTAKVRTTAQAEKLTQLMHFVAQSNGIQVRVVQTDGTSPVGCGIGPALEARDVLSVLRGEERAPQDLRQRALSLTAELLEFCGLSASLNDGLVLATKTLDSGAAYAKFVAICQAQGDYREPEQAPIQYHLLAEKPGQIRAIHNRHLSRLAFLLGAPEKQGAGVELHRTRHDYVAVGDVLMTLHAESESDIVQAKHFLQMYPVFEMSV